MKTRRPRYLSGLTAIAAYLGISRRTVQRYMKDAGLPVLASGHNRVAALPERVDAWRAQRDEDSAA
jgi:predicted site-specific integrase-resolvase